MAKDAKVTDAELAEIVSLLAADPKAGDIVPGTGGARKVRMAGKGRGKRGSYRTYHYFGGDDVPVFLLAVLAKNQKADLSAKHKDALAKILPLLGDSYRASVARRVTKMRRKT